MPNQILISAEQSFLEYLIIHNTTIKSMLKPLKTYFIRSYKMWITKIEV